LFHGCTTPPSENNDRSYRLFAEDVACASRDSVTERLDRGTLSQIDRRSLDERRKTIDASPATFSANCR
jgi:hypothetical protein